MKLAIFIMVSLAAASALYITPEDRQYQHKRDVFSDIANKIESLIDNIKAKVYPAVKTDSSDLFGQKRDLADAKEKMDDVLAELKKMYKPYTKRGVLVDYATKIEAMINNIKDILSNDSPVQKRNLVDLAKKLEHVVNIYHEVKAFATVAYDVYELVVDIKNMFADSDSAEHKDLVDVASRIEEIVKDTNIFLQTGSEESGETAERRGLSDWNLVDLAKKLESVVNIYHEVKAFGTVAYDVYELARDIKNMFADSDSEEHKTLVDVAGRIEEIVKDTVIFLHTGNQEETHKRDTGYNFWPVKKEKAHMLSRRENQWSVKKEKAHKYSRRGTVLDVATMANAKFAEIKKFLEPFENLE